MAVDLSTFTVNRNAVREGEWVTVGSGDQQFEIKTRGFTPAYRDGLNQARRQAVRELNRKLKPTEMPYAPDTLPPTVDDAIQGKMLATHCVQDVRGLTNGGQPVTADEFKELLRDPEGRQLLLIFALQAAGNVGQSRDAEREQAEGNSSPGSDTPSPEAP